jgi:hypothetical protein
LKKDAAEQKKRYEEEWHLNGKAPARSIPSPLSMYASMIYLGLSAKYTSVCSSIDLIKSG